MNSPDRNHKNRRIGLTACSDALSGLQKPEVDALCSYLVKAGYEPVLSPYIYEKSLAEAGFGECEPDKPDAPHDSSETISEAASADALCCYSGTAVERAGALMDFYRDPSICSICDISGGDMANELLPYLDFEVIASSGKTFWGYSDLTTIINSIYSRTGKSSVLYQARYLPLSGLKPQELSGLFECAGSALQDDSFFAAGGNVCAAGGNALFTPSFRFIQGNSMSGIVVGGNVRCLLKLAGTVFWPDLRGKILLLESMGGRSALMVTYLSQLKLLGVFTQVSGILLGTFTQMEKESCRPDICSLVRHFAGPDLPIAKTGDIGHSRRAKAIRIGELIHLEE